MEWYFELLINLILWILVLFLFFSRKFSEAFAKQVAELATAEKITSKIESVKSDFSERLESFKHELVKEQNKHYFQTQEYQRRRFLSLEKLFSKVIDLQYFIKNELNSYKDYQDFHNKRNLFFQKYDETKIEFTKARLYLDQSIIELINQTLNDCSEAFIQYLKAYNTDPKQLPDIPIVSSTQEIRKIQKMGPDNTKVIEKFNDIVNKKFPEMIDKIEKDVKRNVLDK